MRESHVYIDRSVSMRLVYERPLVYTYIHQGGICKMSTDELIRFKLLKVSKMSVILVDNDTQWSSDYLVIRYNQGHRN
jgi:hypothetical protein